MCKEKKHCRVIKLFKNYSFLGGMGGLGGLSSLIARPSTSQSESVP